MKNVKKIVFSLIFLYFMLMKSFLGIKKFRERLNLMSSKLAKMLNVSNATYSNWEMGKRDPSFGVVQKLFAMGATVEELFGVEYEGKKFQNTKKYNDLLKDNQDKALMLAEQRRVIMESGSEYANEYTNMIKAEEEMLRLHREMEQTDDGTENEAKTQEYKNALKLYEQSRQRVQELLMQDLEEQTKTGNYPKASQIRAMINLKAATSTRQNEFPAPDSVLIDDQSPLTGE